jgi:hypothetical protein
MVRMTNNDARETSRAMRRRVHLQSRPFRGRPTSSRGDRESIDQRPYLCKRTGINSTADALTAAPCSVARCLRRSYWQRPAFDRRRSGVRSAPHASLAAPATRAGGRARCAGLSAGLSPPLLVQRSSTTDGGSHVGIPGTSPTPGIPAALWRLASRCGAE